MLGASRAMFHGASFGGGGGGPGAAEAVYFDGTNDVLERGSNLTGLSNGNELLVSFWYNFKGGDGDFVVLIEETSFIVRIVKFNDKWRIELSDVGGGTLWVVHGNTVYTTLVNTGWHSFLLAIDMDATPDVMQLRLDDVDETLDDQSGPNSGQIGLSLGTDWGIGGISGGGSRADVEIADMWLDDTFLDLDVEANRRKFIDASGKPVGLGSDGSTPTGSQPLIFFSGPTVTWHNNKGTGGGFTEIGALTDASSNPND